MAGVRGVMKLVRQVLNSWKVRKCCELKINCENGVLKVPMTADVGTWVHPESSETCDRDRGHKGPRRKRAGPSYLRGRRDALL